MLTFVFIKIKTLRQWLKKLVNLNFCIVVYFRSAPFGQKSTCQKNPTYFSSYSHV